MTSSIAAIRSDRTAPRQSHYTEADWTDGDDTSRTPYVRSRRSPSRPRGTTWRAVDAEDRLATINPGAIIGPALNDDHSYSLQTIQRLLAGLPAAPQLGFTFVDVRDVADLHIRALTDPAAGGERFIAADRFLWMAQVGAILREHLGAAAKKVPTRVAPNLLIRAMALFDGSVRSVVSDLGKQSWFSSEKARHDLGVDKPRPPRRLDRRLRTQPCSNAGPASRLQSKPPPPSSATRAPSGSTSPPPSTASTAGSSLRANVRVRSSSRQLAIPRLSVPSRS